MEWKFWTRRLLILAEGAYWRTCDFGWVGEDEIRDLNAMVAVVAVIFGSSPCVIEDRDRALKSRGPQECLQYLECL